MTRLEFGPPQDIEQAQFRLPTRDHPSYSSDSVIEHLAHLKEVLDKLLSLHESDRTEFLEAALGQRLVPLNLEDLRQLEQVSYKRQFPPIVENDHAALLEITHWVMIFPSGDDAYGWWRIYAMTPKLIIEDYKLVCIMFNEYRGSHGFPPRADHLDDKGWEIEIGIVTDQELSLLLKDLGRP